MPTVKFHIPSPVKRGSKICDGCERLYQSLVTIDDKDIHRCDLWLKDVNKSAEGYDRLECCQASERESDAPDMLVVSISDYEQCELRRWGKDHSCNLQILCKLESYGLLTMEYDEPLTDLGKMIIASLEE